jgi:hypothetical protein
LLCAKDAKARLSDGLKRHHVRHKAAGTPILPPWQKKKSVADENHALADGRVSASLLDLGGGRPSPAPTAKRLPKAKRNSRDPPRESEMRIPEPVEQGLHAPKAITVTPTLGSVIAGPAPKRRQKPWDREIKAHPAVQQGRERVCRACVLSTDFNLGTWKALVAATCRRCGGAPSDGVIVIPSRLAKSSQAKR